MTMTKKEWEQFKTKPLEELKKNLLEYREKARSLKTDLKAGKVKNVKEIKNVKKFIARILTLINATK